MSEIRVLADDELAQFASIASNAYPGFERITEEQVKEDVDRLMTIQHEDPLTSFYGLFRDGELLGGMRLHDFQMQLYETRVPAGGLGLLAVDLLHKKEHVAKELVQFFLNHYRQRGVNLALLYPFRPDFYRQMGFGYGAKMHQYRVRPDSLPRAGAKQQVTLLTQDESEALWSCYHRVVARTHGLIEKSDFDLRRLFSNRRVRIAGYWEEGRLLGYMVFLFKKGEHFLLNDIDVRELIYETPEALHGLCAFLHAQADQIQTIILNLQDEDFHFLPADPRDGSDALVPSVYHQSNVSGVGLMYRVLNVKGLFRQLSEHRFGDCTCRIKLRVEDSFLAENAGEWVIDFQAGRPRIEPGGPYDVEVRLDVASFSSLVMGVIPFRRLYEFGLATLSDPDMLAVVDRVFHTPVKPICTTGF